MLLFWYSVTFPKLPRLVNPLLHREFENGNYFSSARTERYAKNFSGRANLCEQLLMSKAASSQYGHGSRPLG
jgi:hypothetical protein